MPREYGNPFMPWRLDPVENSHSLPLVCTIERRNLCGMATAWHSWQALGQRGIDSAASAVGVVQCQYEYDRYRMTNNRQTKLQGESLPVTLDNG